MARGHGRWRAAFLMNALIGVAGLQAVGSPSASLPES